MGVVVALPAWWPQALIRSWSVAAEQASLTGFGWFAGSFPGTPLSS